MGEQKRVGRKTGPKPSFTRSDVVDAAIALRLDTFTLSRVAGEIGVVTSALYRRFADRDDLLGACLDRVAGTIAAPTDGMTWQEVLQLWAQECWRVCEDFPGLVQTVYSHATAFTHVATAVAPYAAALEGHGYSRGQVAFALDFLGDTVFSCYLGVEMLRARNAAGVSGVEQIRERTSPDHLFQPEDSWGDRGFTDVKVNFIIEGLERHWPEM